MLHSTLTIELREGVEEHKKELLINIHKEIPEHWRKIVDGLKVVLFQGLLRRNANRDIQKLENTKGIFWDSESRIGESPKFSKVSWVSILDKRIIFIRTMSVACFGLPKSDYQIKRDFLTAFAGCIWNSLAKTSLPEFCKREFVVDYPNFFLGWVLRETEVAANNPRLHISNVRRLLEEQREIVARDNFCRIWQLYISSPDYLEEKMTEMIVSRMQQLDELVASGKIH